jgi:hypothetical protein
MRKMGVLIVISLAVCVSAQAQSDQDEELNNVGKSLTQRIAKEMPGWNCRSIQPIEGSRHVIIRHCESSNIVVKIAVTEYLKLETAESAFKEFKSHLRLEEQVAQKRGKELRLVKEDLSTLGDEGYVSDDRGSEAVAFRKGRFIVNVLVVRPEDNNDVFFSRKFAHHVAKVLELQ